MVLLLRFAAQRLDEGRIVVLDTVDVGRDRVRLQGRRFGNLEQFQRSFRLGDRWIQPRVYRLTSDHHWHSIMDVPGRVSCFGGDHRTGAQPCGVVLGRLVRVAPDLIDTRHDEQAAVGSMDKERLLAWLASAAPYRADWRLSGVPLIEAVSRQDAAASAKGAP